MCYRNLINFASNIILWDIHLHYLCRISNAHYSIVFLLLYDVLNHWNFGRILQIAYLQFQLFFHIINGYFGHIKKRIQFMYIFRKCFLQAFYNHFHFFRATQKSAARPLATLPLKLCVFFCIVSLSSIVIVWLSSSLFGFSLTGNFLPPFGCDKFKVKFYCFKDEASLEVLIKCFKVEEATCSCLVLSISWCTCFNIFEVWVDLLQTCVMPLPILLKKWLFQKIPINRGYHFFPSVNFVSACIT